MIQNIQIVYAMCPADGALPVADALNARRRVLDEDSELVKNQPEGLSGSG
jgi:hypothetical protein